MARKKMILYGSITLAFLLFCLMYLLMMLQSTEEIYQQRLNETLDSSASEIENYLNYSSKELLFEVNMLSSSNTVTKEALLEELQQLSKQKEDAIQYYVLEQSGALYSSNGRPHSFPIDRALFKTVATEGFAITTFTDSQLGSTPFVAMTVPIQGQSLYVVEVLPLAQFFDNLSRQLSFTPHYLALFDEWGNMVGAAQTPNGAVSPRIEQSVQSDAGMYVGNRLSQKIQPAKGRQFYNVYVDITQPSQWFLGAQVDFSQDYPRHSGIISSSLVIFCSWLFLVGIIIALDLINEREKKKELFLISNIDQLTGLINGSGMQEAMTAFIQHHPMQGYSLVCTDIAAFNRVNSMFGYSMGDLLLRTVSNVIKMNYLSGVRTNADRFAFFAKSTPQLSTEIESGFYEAIRAHMGEEYLQMVSFKFGIYPMSDERISYKDAYEGALLALKSAKKMPQQSQVVYNAELGRSADLRRHIEINMMHALSKEEFLVYIHPQFHTDRSVCRRGEALVRWQSEFMGFLPPDKFVPLFEANGFIVEIDFFMLSSVMQILEERIAAGKEPFTVAVNQSRVTISFPNYYSRLKALVERFSTIPMNYIELEITESSLESDLGALIPLIHNIKHLGFTVSLDDFGSGFSSLNTLRLLPIDVLKIDRAFLQESDSSERSRKIIRSVINMAVGLDIQVICEGVETEEHLEFLRGTECAIVQGFYYSKPIPYQEFISLYIDNEETTTKA